MTSDLAFTDALARLADLPPDAELTCTHCGVTTLAVALADTEVFPSRGPECEECTDHEALRVADEHDDDVCRCWACERAMVVRERGRRVEEAALRMGGGAWLEDA